mgnify:CR=1 FL=1|tara:strand:- start:4732 stop:5799 length:1068 start_codon:yes stop_codon:yes gene_type:complete
MFNYKKLFSTEPFSISQKLKENWYFKDQKKLSLYHYRKCTEYKKISDKIFNDLRKSKTLSDLPFVHANIFKEFNLKSTKNINLSKTLTSSGTSNSITSKINLDRKTSLLQSRALSHIFSNILKNKRPHIFFIDSPDVLKGPDSLSARGSAIKGFSQLVRESEFLLDTKFNLKISKLINFLKKNPNKDFIIFGFTSFIWSFLIKQIIKMKINIPKNKGILIHGGGWKKMHKQAIDRNLFNKKILETVGIKTVHNYYGMVEQTGSIFLECEYGYFHSSIFSEIFIRDNNLKLSPIKKKGLIQVLSLLPLSYPGHNILTEDVGKIEGIDNCKCGRKGKYFSIEGRVPGTEIRGCSDAY